MTFRHIECAIEIARCGSMNRAAADLGVSQPYLSGIIKSLEEELGYEIFIRTKTGIALTENGSEFINRARVIMEELRAINSIGIQRSKGLRVATYYSTFFMRRFLDFRAESNEDADDAFREMGNFEIMDAVVNRDSSLGIIVFPGEKREKYFEKLRELGLTHFLLYDSVRLHAVVSARHPLASRQTVTISEMRTYPYVAFADESSQSFLATHIGLTEHNRVLRVSDRAGFNDAIRSGNYLSVLSNPVLEGKSAKPASAGVKALKEDGFIILSISDAELYLEAHYITTRGYRLTDREQAFIKYLM
ncbi:MAG: LysR family transcriptional regulator [Mogibacterium sp.]|nr:LysR family transcriptional regulator [Mogibacterium sp.]